MEYYIRSTSNGSMSIDSCDFVETKFNEYETYNDYRKDKYKIEKGMIIVLIKDNTELVYEYMPLFNNSEQFIEDFTESVYKKYGFEGNKLEHNNYKWFKNIYWKLDTFSCVYVPRNKKWVETALPKFDKFWKKIVEERKIPESI